MQWQTPNSKCIQIWKTFNIWVVVWCRTQVTGGSQRSLHLPFNCKILSTESVLEIVKKLKTLEKWLFIRQFASLYHAGLWPAFSMSIPTKLLSRSPISPPEWVSPIAALGVSIRTYYSNLKSLIAKLEHDCEVMCLNLERPLAWLVCSGWGQSRAATATRKGKMNERRKGGAWKVGKIIEGEDGWREGGDQREQNFILLSPSHRPDLGGWKRLGAWARCYAWRMEEREEMHRAWVDACGDLLAGCFACGGPGWRKSDAVVLTPKPQFTNA